MPQQMRLGCIVAVMALLTGLSSRSSAAQVRARCELPRGARILEKNRQAVIYLAGSRRRTVVGCFRRTGRRTVLVRRSSVDGFYQFVDTYRLLRGRHVAIETVGYGRDVPDYLLIVTDLKTGNNRFTAPSDGEMPADANAPVRRPTIGRAVIDGDGGTAWTVTNYGVEPVRTEVYALAETGPTGKVLLDAGPEVDLDSIRLAYGRLTWFSGGELRAALMPPA